MLWPFRDSGWAQVAVTEACSILPSNHGGSHFSWQSHRKLSLLMWLKGKHRGVTDQGKLSLRTQRVRPPRVGLGRAHRRAVGHRSWFFLRKRRAEPAPYRARVRTWLGTQQLGDPGELTPLACAPHSELARVLRQMLLGWDPGDTGEPL